MLEGVNCVDISFEVDGLPPRKDGGRTMWSKDKEVEKLLNLRKQFYETLQKNNVDFPISEFLKVKIEIYLLEKDLRRSDIDNLVGGVFDGFQSADAKAKLNDGYKEYEDTPIHPLNSFLDDDSRILELNVKKIVSENRTFYRVSMESLKLDEIRAEIRSQAYSS